jgi:hypothetical protein
VRKHPGSWPNRKVVPVDEKLIARFWTKVDRRGPDECWEWQAARNARGYGVGWIGTRTRLAHRIAWFLTQGAWPSDCLCHQCDNPRCCNPQHLWEGSRADNLEDMRAKGRGSRPPVITTRGESHAVAKLTEAQAKEVLRRGYTGDTHAAIAAEFKTSISNVNAILSGRSWKHLQRPLIDLRHHQTKLTPELVRLIRQQAIGGASRHSLAEAFGISRATIGGVLNRKTWRHVA